MRGQLQLWRRWRGGKGTTTWWWIEDCGLNDNGQRLQKEKEKGKRKTAVEGREEKTYKFFVKTVVLLFGPLPCSLSKSCEEMGHVRTR